MNGKWLITGASGQLGGHVIRELLRRDADARIHAVVAPSNGAGHIAGVELVRLDLREEPAIRDTLRAVRPTIIVHAGAMTAVADAYNDPAGAQRVNVDATRVIAEQAVALGARLVFTSTDMVFGGDRAPYREDDPPAPLSTYGRSKAAAEPFVRAAPRGLVVRAPLMYGFPLTPRNTTFGQQVAALREGRLQRMFTDEYRTVAWLADVARALLVLATSDLTGTVHIAGPERLSRLQMVERYAACLGVAPVIEPISRLSILTPEPRPADLSLDGSRFAAMFPAFAPGPIRAEAFATE
ncbi:MAG: NAD(P)-dependent oxidoreductase [Phycisphaerae bacterium]